MLNPEHLLIPFQASQLLPGPWLVFAPHADDETFGMGGSLLKAKKENVETHLVVLTDGAFGGEREDLVKVREEEVNRAAQLLGIKSLHCWSEPDRGLDHNESLVGKITDTIRSLAPAAVFFPGPFEIHPDHRATAFLVWSALQQLRENGVSPEAIAYEIGVQNPGNLLIDVTDQYAEKKEAMAIYASQNNENNYEELVLALDKGRTFSLPAQVEFAEGFFRFQSKDMALSLQEVTHKIVDLYQ
jgi:LmbE family N-acetylglucosaminyl deacetylase